MNAHTHFDIHTVLPLDQPRSYIQLNNAPYIKSIDRMHKGTITDLAKRRIIYPVAAVLKTWDTQAVYTFDSMLTAVAWFNQEGAPDRNEFDLRLFDPS